MAFSGLLLFLLLDQTFAQLEVSAPSPQRALNGSTVVLPCTFSINKMSFDPKYLAVLWSFWGRQILLYDNKGITKDPRVAFDGEAAKDGNASLTVANVTLSDGGTYSCMVIYSPERIEKNIVLDVQARPGIILRDKAVRKDSENTLICEAVGFFPEDIEITWTLDGRTQNNSYIKDQVKNNDGTYNVSSAVTLTMRPESKILSCAVHHASLHQPLREELLLRCEDRSPAGIIAACSVIILIILIAGVLYWKLKLRRKVSGPFIVRDIEGPPKLIDGEEATLYYTVDNCPENLCVTWLMRRAGQVQEIQTSQIREHSEEEEGLLDASYVIRSQREGHQYLSSLSFIPHMERHKDVTFICRGVSSQHNDEKKFHLKPKLSQTVIRSLFVSGEIKYLLNLEKFYPKTIKIIWMCGVGEPEEVLSSTESVSDNPDRTYSISSEVRIPEERHKDSGFRVRVTWEHESLGEAESRELSIRDSDYIWMPVVEEIQIPRLLHDTPATLQCNISEYFPDAVTVRWRRRAGDEIYEETENQRITSRRAADKTYNCTSSLTITPTLETHQGTEYICLVEHPTLETPIEKTTGRLQVLAEPQMPDPIQISMADSSRVQLSLNLQKFYPKDIQISWRWENTSGKYVLSPEQTFRSQKDLTYDVTSVVRISNNSFNNPEMKIIVVWKHETMETAETRSLSIRDLSWTPHVGSIWGPELEDGKSATLFCDISGYFPDLLSVSWFIKRDGNLTALPIESMKTNNNYKISHKKKRQKDKTYFYEASMTFTPLISSDEGSEILCRVEHPSLETPIETSTQPLHIGVKKKTIADDVIQGFETFFTHSRKEKFSSKTNSDEIDMTQEANDEDNTTEDRGAEVQEETKNLTLRKDNGS
ncbi:uncharacterized protein LOC122944576 isoform X2 [Bufo gargarizans]|uniref:uncharacterized protein LOC122944576 isoform X2 n=1 Tax=Bufo gargarizans TaxID=30331 RepID=UPI001CF5A894|nr:uncharacterized protein LOC122944576 isoform X2 [Bufo gargarizans]